MSQPGRDRWMLWTLAALFAVGGCSGDNSASPTTAAPTTAGSSSTTAPPTTTTTSAPPTSATTLATTTTQSVESQVTGAYLARQDAYVACVRAPASCDPAALTASQGPARADLTKTVADLKAGGLHLGPDDPGYVVVEAVQVDPGGQRAVLTVCGWDTGVLYGPPAQSGGPEVVVNNLQVSKRLQVTMYLEGGAWKLGEEKGLERNEGVNRCPPKQ
jgi:hypothetical protein